jgi:hypothetical protein
MISVPDALLHLLAKFPKGFLGPIPDFDKRMEKAQDHRDLIKQSLPSILRGWPAIGIDGFRSLIGIHSLGFVGKDTIGWL